MHYLDHAASSPLRPAAREAWLAAADLPGNPGSTHRAGREARRILDDARDEMAALLGAEPAEVLFTSGGTEADNIAVQGAARHGLTRGRPRVVVSAIEHPAVLEAAALADGCEVVHVPAGPDGRSLPTAPRVDVSTSLVSLMWVNNETGVVQDVAEAVRAAHDAGALAHSDAVQAVGHLPVDFAASGLDLLSLSGHKLGAPVGVGVLLARRGVPLRAVYGGGGQERDLRSGTVDVAGAAALAAAVREAVGEREVESARLAALREKAARAVTAIPGARVTGADLPAELRAPHILHAIFEGLRSEDLLFALDRAGISASAGSACRAGVHQPSHVVLAMGGSEAEASGVLRVSLGWTTTEADVATLRDALPAAVERARTAHGFRH